ncbi:MAG: radical SAM protein [Candidatus Hodarchaeota archaeon]
MKQYCIQQQIIQTLDIKKETHIKQIYKKKRIIKSELLLWNLINKLPLRKIFRQFLKVCPFCGRKYSEIFIDYYINNKISCTRCKFNALLNSSLAKLTLNIVAKTLEMPKNAFRKILKNSPSLKRLVLTYIEGIGIYGLRVPQVPAGPIITLWSITHRCNLNCTHCYIHQKGGMKELSFNEVCNVIDQLYEARNYVLGFSGGEALLRADIYEIINYASKKKMHLALATNGTLITPEVAKKLKDAGLGYVQVSIDGLEEIHNQIRGSGVFRKAIQGIKNCIEIGLYVSMDVVITKLNVNQIHDLINLAKELGVSKFEILDFVPSEKAACVEDIALTPLEMEKFGVIVCDIWQQLMEENYPMTLSYKNPIFNKILAQRYPNIGFMPFFKGTFPKDAIKFFNFSERLVKGVFGEQTPFSPFITGCESGIYVIHIKPDGDVTPCPLNPAYLGNIKKHHIQKIWQQSPILNKYRNLKFKGHCGKCVYKTVCGGCRAKVFLKTGTYDHYDHTCVLNCKN